MQISQINSSHKKPPTFGFWKREVIIPYKGLVNRNDTVFYREQNFFPRLTRFLSLKFKDIPKVNVYCYGCSDGSEPFTFAMQMLTMHDETNPKKYFPIIARDLDPVAIQKAMENDYKMIKKEKDYIDYFTYGQLERFFYLPYGVPTENSEGTTVFVKNELYNNVDFKEGDIFKDLKNINPKNSVVMARNFWPYIDDYAQRTKFFKKLYNHLNSGSYFVTGEFDHSGINWGLGNLHNEIMGVGFKPTSLKYVYVKE